MASGKLFVFIEYQQLHQQRGKNVEHPRERLDSLEEAQEKPTFLAEVIVP